MPRALLILLATFAGAAPASAQHPARASVSSVTPAEQGCEMCHASHGAAVGPYSLQSDDLPGLSPELNALPPDIAGISRSCLRCHATPSQRARQPQFARRSLLAVEGGKYLGLDLSDDHPLGRLERYGWPELDASGRRRPFDRPSPALRSDPSGEQRFLGCTGCHDPHDRSPTISAEEQQMLCGSCHDLGRYALQNHSSLACSSCHVLHGGHEAALLAEPIADVLCASCHNATGLARVRPGDEPASLNAPQGHIEPPAESCTTCHAAHP